MHMVIYLLGLLASYISRKNHVVAVRLHVKPQNPSPIMIVQQREIGFIVIDIIIITSTSDLQPSKAIENQIPGQLVSTQIKTKGPNCFKFVMALFMSSRNIA